LATFLQNAAGKPFDKFPLSATAAKQPQKYKLTKHRITRDKPDSEFITVIFSVKLGIIHKNLIFVQKLQISLNLVSYAAKNYKTRI